MSDRRARRHDDAKDEILAAAWSLADRDGIAGLSLRELASKVGMRPPSLYTYFESKDALYDALYVDANRQLMERLAGFAARTPPHDPVARLTEGLETWIRFCQESIARYQILYTRAVPGWAPAPEAYSVAVEAYEQAATAAAAAGITEPEDLDMYTAIASGLVAQQMANDPTGDRWRRLAERSIRMLLADIGKAGNP
jgi:AcrR family transcriptional regulator